MHQIKRLVKIRKGPNGLHLFNRSSGINILLDEISFSKSEWTNSPRQVSIALTNHCDLKCSHCYAPKTPFSLDKESIKKWMCELDNAGCFGVGFGGGEPTTYKHLVELCQFGQKQTQLAISMTTHGHHLTDQLINHLIGNVNFLRVSMDGIGVTYEKIRHRSFMQLKANLSKLAGKISFGVNYIINSKTIDDLDDATSLLESLGAEELLLLPEEPIGRGKKIDSISLSKLKKWVKNYNGHLRLAVSSNYQHEFETINALKLENENDAFAHIDASGQLKMTSFSIKGEVIKKDGVIAAYNRLINRNMTL